MEFTSKQRSYLKGLASAEDAIFQIGKSSITPAMVQAVDDAIEKRELIKLSVLKNCMDDPRELAEIMAERTHSNVIVLLHFQQSSDVHNESGERFRPSDQFA